MTVKELKEMLEQFDDDLIVEVNDSFGEYDEASGVYEGIETYWETAIDFKAKKSPKTRDVVKIY